MPFDATFRYTSHRGGRPSDFEFVVRPETVGMTVKPIGPT